MSRKCDKPKLDSVTVRKTIETVINDNLLHLLPETELEQVWGGSQKLKTVLAPEAKADRDLFPWNYAGVLVQTGEWRNFHSYEETWTVLASFWGMGAPDAIPTCTTWSTFQDTGRPIGQGNYKRYYRYLEIQRKSALTTSGDPDTGATDPKTPQPPKKPHVNLEILLSMVDSTWKPDLHKGLDYLWTIMDEFERESFLKGITTVSTSTSMSTVVPMPPKLGQSVTRPSPPQPPPDPDAPDPNPDEEEEENEEDEEDEEEQDEGGAHGECEEEEEKEVDEAEEIVESESTKMRRKLTEHQQRVYDAAMTRLPFALAEKGPLYKGVEITPNDRPKPSIRWRAKKGAIPKPKDKSPLDHRGNRAFENIRGHQISSLFTLQKHFADCEKGARERI